MNHFYRLVRSADGTRYVPAPETAKGRGKASKAVASVSVLLGLVAVGGNAWAQAPPVNALPTGGQVTAGQASIGQSGNQMTVNQGSDRAVIHWQGFDIGSQAAVRFNQPGTSSVALNRVVAGDASQIHGQLSANGQVWVLNPNGVVFGQGSRVDVGGLVASTLHSSDADFMAGKAVFSRNSSAGSAASVINQGEITAHGDGGQAGLVALLAPTVQNEGIIRAQLGNVVMAAGDRITLSAGVGGRLQVAVEPSTVQTLIENKQLIVADGGQVLMTSRAADALSAGVVSNTGTVQARTLAQQEGRIVLLADMQHGSTQVAGLLDASAPAGDGGGHGGNGGFVDTSAARVQIQAGARVTTLAANGKTGEWLIDPTDFTISAGGATQTDSGIGADTLVANLAHTDVRLQTVDSGSEAGSIHVNADVRYSANQLTLNAHHDININASIDVGGSGTLALNYGGTQGNTATAPAADSQLNVKGRVNFAQAGTGLLSINGQGYTVIKDVTQLQAMETDLAGHYALGGDIDASATAIWNCNAGTCNGFKPIGSNSDDTDATRFTGSLDGLGHSIRDLTVNVTQPQYTNTNTNYSYAGLFGYTGGSARIAHVGLENASIQASGGDWNYAGALVGLNDGGGSILQSYATGSATASGGTENYAGALVGSNNGSGSISISQSYATGSATASGGSNNYAGALVGRNYSGSILQSYATGSATASGGSNYNYAGALVGWNSGRSSIHQSYATGSATASGGSYGNFAGALVGKKDGGAIETSFWNADARDASNVLLNGVGSGSVTDPNVSTGLTLGQMQNARSFAAWGSDIDDQGGTGAAWRIYEGQSTPLLRSFLKAVSVSISDQEYSGTTGFTLDSNQYQIGALQPGDALDQSAGGQLSATTGSKNVGSYQTGNGSLTVSGLYSHQQGYDISYALKVTPKALTVSGITADDKVYDGLTDATVNSGANSLSGLIANDHVNVTGQFDDKNVNANKNVTLAFSGADVDNYTITGQASTTASITPKALTVSGIAADDKDYDGTTGAVLNTAGVHYAGLIAGDDLSVSATGVFADKNAGHDKNVALTSQYAGADKGNYTITGQTSTTARITPKALTVTADAASKVYGDTDALRYTSSGLLAGDSLSGSLGRAAGDNVGSYAIDQGTLANGNYAISFVGNTLTITPKALTIAGTTADGKVYDGTATASLNAGTLQGLVGNETLGVSATGQFDSANAGARNATAQYQLADGGNGGLASNYTLADTHGHSATITPQALTITAAHAYKTVGEGLVFQGLEFTAQGLVGGEQIQSVQLDSAGAAARAAPGSYAIVASQPHGGAGFDARNYDIRYVDGQLQVRVPRTALGGGDLWRIYHPQQMQQPDPQQKKPLLTIEPDHIRMAAM